MAPPPSWPQLWVSPTSTLSVPSGKLVSQAAAVLALQLLIRFPVNVPGSRQRTAQDLGSLPPRMGDLVVVPGSWLPLGHTGLLRLFGDE